MKIAVLGAGLVGRAIALDLSKDFEVTSFDINKKNLEWLFAKNSLITTNIQDLTNLAAYPHFLKPFDFVVTAVPGFMGFQTIKAVIESGKSLADISFFPEDPSLLNELAKEKNVTAIVDCGVAPGMSNLIIGRYNQEMEIDAFEIYVGGLPVNPVPPFNYKAPFSPVDVIEEYTRPARIKENGSEVIKPALTDIEDIEFNNLGKLEAFNTDGLRTLLETMKHIPNQKEKTLRYPGHASLILALQQGGFFSEEKMQLKDCSFAPLDFTTKILFDQWKLREGEEELTAMMVKLIGKEKIVEYELLEYYDPVSGISSMARSTGYTCTAALHLLVNKMFTKKGVFPPEIVGADERCFNFILEYLAQRSVHWKKKELDIGKEDKI